MFYPKYKAIENILEDFVGKDVASAVEILTSAKSTGDMDAAFVTVACAFGADKKTIAIPDSKAEEHLVSSFKKNLTLLIQKTWVEQSDTELKERILYQLEEFCKDIKKRDATEIYTLFLEIIDSAVYLMFGSQTKDDDFVEYAFRVDPEFGIFWWYMQSLPRKIDWSERQCRLVIFLGMYFLANY